MKNSKNLKTTLSAISIIAIFVAMIMSIVASVAQTPDGYNYLYTIYNVQGTGADTTWQVCLDWDYAGIFLAFLVIGFITSIIKFAKFTVPAVRSRATNANMTLICDIAVLLGLAFIIIGMFMPEGVEMKMGNGYEAVTDAGYDKTVVASIAAWVGAPLAFIASLGTIGLSRSTKK